MPRHPPNRKPPDPTSVRTARTKARLVAEGKCQNGSKHAAPVKGVLCLKCWAVKNAPRFGMTVQQVIDNESLQLTLPGALSPRAPLSRAPANDQVATDVPSKNGRGR